MESKFRDPALLQCGFYLTQSVFTVVLQKSTSPQIRQPILYCYQYKDQVDGFVWELTFAKRLHEHVL